MSSEEREARWYLMSTKRGKEVLASRALERVCVEVFLPLIYQRPGSKPEPAFPGCIFVRLDMQTSLLAATSSRGMRDFMTVREPIEVPDPLMTELKAVATARLKEGREAVAVPDPVRGLLNRKIASLQRTVGLFRIIEERKTLEVRSER